VQSVARCWLRVRYGTFLVMYWAATHKVQTLKRFPGALWTFWLS
jgi:hypothetical protein